MTLLHVIKYSDINLENNLDLLRLPPSILLSIYLGAKKPLQHWTYYTVSEDHIHMAAVVSKVYKFSDINKRNFIQEHIKKLLLEYDPT